MGILKFYSFKNYRKAFSWYPTFPNAVPFSMANLQTHYRNILKVTVIFWATASDSWVNEFYCGHANITYTLNS